MNKPDRVRIEAGRCSHASSRKAGLSWQKTIQLSLSVAIRVVVLMAGLVPSAHASLDELSNMDCVIEPSVTVDLGSAVPGLIARTYFDRSDFVSKGTIMAQLESDVEKVALAVALQVATNSTALELRKETAEFGERNRVRNEKLLKTAGISRQVVDQVSTEARIAQLQVLQEQESQRLAELDVQRAQATLSRRLIRSPIDGNVVQMYKRAGEYVDSDPVYQIAQLDPLNVEVIVPVEYLGNLSTGMSAAITIDVPGFENQELTAEVRRIDAVADAASATYGVRLVLDNPEMKIPSGVRCHIDFLAS